MKANKKVESKIVTTINKDDTKIKKVLRSDWDKYNNELETLTTKSSKIRLLLSKEWNRSDVANKLGIIYQHVRNVEVTPIKKQK